MDNPETFQYNAVFGGLAWPTPETPAYYLIFGRPHEELDYGQKSQDLPLEWFTEYTNEDVLSLDGFFERLTTDAAYYNCTKFYTLTYLADTDKDDWAGYVSMYDDYCRAHDVKKIAFMEQAPFDGNFLLGLNLINSQLKTKKINLPEKSVARNQLRGITMSDIKEQPQNKYYAINALRYVIGAYHKFRPTKARVPLQRKKMGWMSR